MDGSGIIRYADGSCYEGQFKNDKYEGKGKLMFKNGGSYEGEFINNLMEGKGKYIYPDDKIYEGYFKMDWSMDLEKYLGMKINILKDIG